MTTFREQVHDILEQMNMSGVSHDEQVPHQILLRTA